MKTLNKAEIIGRLGQQPVIKQTPKGEKLANLSIATNESFKDKSGQWVENTEWHKVVVFGSLADIASRLKKGQLVSIVGKLKTRQWEDKFKAKHYTTEIIVEGFSGIMHVIQEQKEPTNNKALNGDIEEKEEK